jgi:diacylglycerol O-acyltransferase / wax synthase
MPAPVRTATELLSFGDALFLYLEREGIPLNVASVAVFDGPMSADDLIRYLDSKRSRIPRFRQRVVTPPFNVGLPSWQDDPTFDVANHVHEVTLKHGTDRELKAVASRILSTTLDRRHPLWDQTLVHGLKGNRSAIIFRIHHALADGVSGVGILHELLSTTPDVPPLPKRKHHVVEAVMQPDPLGMMLDGIVSTCMYATQRAMEAQGQIMAVAQQIVASLSVSPDSNPSDSGAGNGTPSVPSLDQLGRLLPELASATYRLPFNKTICHGPQEFRWAEVSLTDIKAVKNHCGGTVNDVILSIVTSTIRRYAELHNVDTAGKLVRIVVPVNVRGNGDVANLGNEITFVPASLPLDITDGRALVHAVHERMAMLKVARIGELVGIAATIFGAIPTAVQAFLGPIASQLPISACNTICTNVPGPREPLYLLGRKLVAIHPYVPIGGEMGMNCAILTYEDTAFFGFTADTGAMPDAQVLEKFVTESFAEICHSVGVRPQRKTASATTKRHDAKATDEKPAARRVKAAAPKPLAEVQFEPTVEEKVVATASAKGFTAGA